MALTPFIALLAPAGYGKSIALAQIARATGRPLAWLSADPRDSDPVTMARSCAAAIDQVAPLPDVAVRSLEAPGRTLWSSAIPRLAAAVSGGPSLTFVVDDVDRIDDDEAVSVILAIADNLPPGSRVLLGGRSAGRLPHARLVAQRRLTTFDRDQLALDPREAHDLLTAAGRPLSEDDELRLLERTEGWAAGVYLTALTAEVGAGDRRVSPTAPERQIEEYLRSEVLAAMAPDDRDLLLRSSVLERLSGPLCDATLERTGSGATLDRLERTNLFLIPLDADRSWYRTHHLLGEFLRRELERRDPGAASDVLRRAAAWHEEHGLPEAALEYALAGGDEERAAGLTVRLGQAAMNSGRSETARRWFQWFDDRRAIVRHPDVAAYAALVFAIEGDEERASRWLAAADEAGSHGSAPGTRAIAGMVTGRHGVAAMVADGRSAVALVGAEDPWRVAALAGLGIACQLDGDREAARDHLDAAIVRYDRGSPGHLAATLALIASAADALERGARSTAEQRVRRARAIVRSHGLGETTVALGVDALEARLAMAHGAAEQARAQLAHAQRLRPHVGVTFPWLAIRARLDLVRAHLALGDAGGARTIMAEVHEILRQRPDMGTILGEVVELDARLAAFRGGVAGSSTLTLAELRLLPLLTTHLSFREIGERLYVSQNTVKTQAISIYRKLDATSRGEAIDHAVAIGLLESSAPGERFIPGG